MRLVFAIVCLSIALSPISARSQTALPDAPSTPAHLHLFLAPEDLVLWSQSDTPVAQQPAEAAEPMTTMFPHPDDTRYYLAGQANIIFQSHPSFHSPYQGQNSLHGGGEYKTSLLGTVYGGYQPHRNIRYNTDFIVDMESAGGRGMSEALGLAGFTNLDVVRNPNLGSSPYLARGVIKQTIGLTNETTDSERTYFSLPTKVPVRRFEVMVGKMSLPDVFDLNSIGSDSHLQFMNWTVDNNGAWDYAADTRGYTVGGVLEYDDRDWSFRYGIFAMPTVANGIDLDWAFSRARGQNWEFELRHSLVHGRKGTERVLAFVNNAHMGDYRDAVVAYLTGKDATPDVDAHAKFGAVKYGFTWNNEQEVTDHLRLFSRFGWNEGQHESYAYTEVDQTVEAGGDYAGSAWGRSADKVGVTFVSNAIKKDHQNYLADGGLGFLLGDGKLNYGRENIEESYYNLHTWRGMFFALDLQHINNPGYNRDRGAVWVPSVRAHVDF
ncbi:carbohydrate porin [Silvibacterium sp.]|uniref:carbohydrate porin n=1 Tax=Silvibacterium sp. TaxID=1964179 RepID=UPI0039E3B676